MRFMGTFTISELQNMINVNMGDYKISKGDRKLITRDLGSCVGISMYDPQTGVGGLLHIMLPHYNTLEKRIPVVYAKYADTGIEEMVRELTLNGAVRSRLVAKIAGAAHMIKSANVSESDDISSRNLEAVRKKLLEMNIPILASEVGEHYPRTVVFEPGNGSVIIITSGRPDRYL